MLRLLIVADCLICESAFILVSLNHFNCMIGFKFQAVALELSLNAIDLGGSLT